MKSTRLRGLLYFLAGFLPAWVSEASAIVAGELTGLGWSILIAKSLIPGIAAVIAFNDKSTSRSS